MAKPIIYVSNKKIEINGDRVEIMTYLTELFSSLVESKTATKEELHEAVDMAFMSNDELKKLAKKKMENLLDNIIKVMGTKENE